MQRACEEAAAAVAAAVTASHMGAAKRAAMTHVVGVPVAADGHSAVMMPAGPRRRWWDAFNSSQEYKEAQRRRARSGAAGSMVFNTLLHALTDLQRYCADTNNVPAAQQAEVKALTDQAVDLTGQLLIVVSPSLPVLPLSALSPVDVALPCCCCVVDVP